MWPYWLMFLLVAWMALTHMRVRPVVGEASARWSMPWRIGFVLLVLMIGFRDQVGGDWGYYVWRVDDVKDQALSEVMRQIEPSYVFLSWLGANGWGGIYFVDTVCGLIFCWGLLVFCRAQPRPWLALVVAVPYLITVVAMGYSRQGVAIGLAMLGLTALMRGSVLRFMLWVAVAATFHKSAVILVPLAVFAGSRHWILTWLGVGIVGMLLFRLLLEESVDSLMSGYIEAEYASSGAAIRVAMNAVPAAIFLLYRKRFALSEEHRVFWTWMSLGALVFVGLMIVSPSSTAVDRVALYWIPLQLFVLSRLPGAFSHRGRRADVWVYAVVAYSAAVLFVWLMFADHAYAWIPYRFYPWEALWQ